MFSLLLDDLIVGLIIIFVNVKLFPPRLMWSKEQVSDMLLLSRIRELENLSLLLLLIVFIISDNLCYVNLVEYYRL